MRVATNISFALDLVVSPSFNGRGAQDTVQVMCVWLLFDPLADGVEHVPVNLDALISQCWVVERTHDIIHHLVDGDAGMLPGIDDSTERC